MFLTIADLDASLYPEITSLLTRYGQTVALAHLATAEGEIEAYLSVRFNIRPELEKAGSARHKLLLPIARDLAIYHMYSLAETIPAHRTKRYDQGIKMLELMSEGKISLPGVDPAPLPDEPVLTGNIGWGSAPRRPSLLG